MSRSVLVHWLTTRGARLYSLNCSSNYCAHTYRQRKKGYKYNHRIEYFSFIRALHSIEKSDIVIFLCDASENLVDQDLKILNMIIDAGKPILFAMNKIDLLSSKELVNLRNSKKMQSEFMQKIKKVEISALNKKGFKRIFKETNKIIQKSLFCV